MTFPVFKTTFYIKYIKSFGKAYMRRMKKVLLKAKVLHVKPCYTLLYSSIHIGPRSYASVQCSSVLFAGLSQMATYNTANVLKNKSPCWSRKWVGNLL